MWPTQTEATLQETQKTVFRLILGFLYVMKNWNIFVQLYVTWDKHFFVLSFGWNLSGSCPPSYGDLSSKNLRNRAMPVNGNKQWRMTTPAMVAIKSISKIIYQTCGPNIPIILLTQPKIPHPSTKIGSTFFWFLTSYRAAEIEQNDYLSSVHIIYYYYFSRPKRANPRSWGSPSKISGEFLPIWANFVHFAADEFAVLGKFRPNRKKFAHCGQEK
jgi:hypothetical protein